jgi:HPt (histidine-containing phosphotransfer) domain-containing protein
LKEKDMKAIAMHAHKAKGSLLNLGIQRQALTCEKIENHALASNIQECQAVIAELQQELRELLSPPS